MYAPRVLSPTSGVDDHLEGRRRSRGPIAPPTDGLNDHNAPSTLLGVSVDSPYAHKAFQAKLGVDTRLLSDFEPKGEVARAYGSYLDGPGMANRTLVLIDEDGKVAWTYESPNPGEFPGANVIFDALA